MQEKKETRLKEQEELLNKVDKVTLSVDKGKPKRTQSEEICEEFKELEELSPLEDEVVKPSKKKRNVRINNKVLRKKFSKRLKEKEKKVLKMKKFKKKKR